MNRKLTIMILSFLALVPFRLPISVGLIKVFNYVATIGVESIPINVLAGNVIVSKLIYSSFFAALFQIKTKQIISDRFSFELEDRFFDREARDYVTRNIKKDPEWLDALMVVSSLLWGAYVIYDVISTKELFYYLNKL